MKRLLKPSMGITLAVTATLALFSPSITQAQDLIVSNTEELHKANKNAQPGATIILKNGEWKNSVIRLDAKGTKENPIHFKAETPGKVILTGESKLKIGGEHLIIEGLYFKDGYAGKDAVISFRLNKEKVANNCRVTNCAIEDFNNPKRMDENNWVLFYGKQNRLDHSSFRNKKNMGVLLAVILDDDRSRENYHSIDHNYFGKRPPLSSNGGEIVRVGVSQHCEFDSYTQIVDNLFEECDGEAEIVSIKSGSNVVRGNVIIESQGSIVLRHGNFNTVENNIILGNYKPGTGGIRVVNKGQWVVNNFLFGCRGIDFRSPLTVMNGIPNSPAHRYVQVTDAVIANNSFYNCSPVSFCDGSDEERTLPPDNVAFINNLFYNDRDTGVYRTFDDLSGFTFTGNVVGREVGQAVPHGMQKEKLKVKKNKIAPVAYTNTTSSIPDSLATIAREKLKGRISEKPGFQDADLLKSIYDNARKSCGASWFRNNAKEEKTNFISVNCKNAEEVYSQLKRNENVRINLTGTSYVLDRPFKINKQVIIQSRSGIQSRFVTGEISSVFMVGGNGNLMLRNLDIEGSGVKAHNFIETDNSAPVNHFNLSIVDCKIQYLQSANGCKNFFFAHKSTIADSIVIRRNMFSLNDVDYFEMKNELDNKGWYNAEHIMIAENYFNGTSGVLLNVYRGGNDESTLGPHLSILNNKFDNSRPDGNDPFFNLVGVQRSRIAGNQFFSVYKDAVLIKYKDIVRAYHTLEGNQFIKSGKIETNDFVVQTNNISE